MAAAVEASLAVEVDQVDEQLLADTAGEAGGMPDGGGAETCCLDDNVSLCCLLLALEGGKTGKESEK